MGWANKFHDANFAVYLQKFKILCLQETWAPETNLPSLHGFRSFSLPAIKTCLRGRGSGGLTIFISVDLHVDMQILTTCCPQYIQALLIKSKHFGSLICINVYFPPSLSKNVGPNSIWNSLSETLTILECQYPSTRLILCGDFNARIGAGSKQVEGTNFGQDVQVSPVARVSQDTSINKPGLRFLEVLSLHQLQCLNGTHQDITLGTYTYVTNRGASTIDYIAVSANLLPDIHRLEVNNRVESDHFPLSLLFNFEMLLLPCPSQNLNGIHVGEQRIRWSTNLGTSIFQVFESPTFKSLYQEILHSNSDILIVYQTIIQNLRPKLVCDKQFKPNRVVGNRWFDLECRDARKALMHYSRQVFRNNGTTSPDILASMRLSYKALLKQKKDTYVRTQWEQLALAVTEKNEKQFWDIISTGMHTVRPVIIGHISSQQWHTHFSQFYGATSPGNHPSNVSETACLPYWPSVSVSEIKKLIAALALRKASGENMMPPEIFKYFPEWWAPILAKVFTHINNTGIIPMGWKQSVVVPIYKKGDKQDPNNYRPISLLDIDSKLYSKHLLKKLEDWEFTNHIIHPEQVGFRKGQSTIDHCLTLYFLAQQGIAGPTKHLFVAFVDLAAAFDSIDRNLLWNKLANTNIDKRLLFLIKELYSNTTARIRVGISGSLTDSISTNKGVKQGCLLAPLLFNLYLNDIIPALSGTEFFPPSVGSKKISILLYADDMVLISLTRIGLKRLLSKLSVFCTKEKLSINYTKTKVMVFGKRHSHFQWSINGHQIEQCREFKYLGIHFAENLSWKPHIEATRAVALRSIGAILRFYYTTGGHLVAPALKVFQSKVIAQILYGAAVWGWDDSQMVKLEALQNTFLKKLLRLPPGTPAALVRTEVDLPSIRSRIHFILFNYWRIVQDSSVRIFPKLCFEQLSNCKSWSSRYYKLLELYPALLDNFSVLNSREKLREYIFNYGAQLDRQAINNSKFSKWYRLYKFDHQRAVYLVKLTSPKLRQAFTALRFQTMPTAVTDGRYQCIPLALRLCICGAPEIEDLPHYLLFCSLYSEPRTKFLESILYQLHFNTTSEKIFYLLSDTDSRVTHKVSLFALAAMKIRARFITEIAVDCAGDALI